jgi:hypothetical protein
MLSTIQILSMTPMTLKISLITAHNFISILESKIDLKAISKDEKTSVFSVPIIKFETEYPNFAHWYSACQKLGSYIKIEAETHKTPQPTTGEKGTALTWAELNRALTVFFSLMTHKDFYLNQTDLWMTKAPLAHGPFFNLTKTPFKPFVQKLEIPINARVSIHGDLHGDVHSLLTYLVYLQEQGHLDPTDGFKIKDKNFYILFLGDYVDRGLYGAEVLYTIMRLKLANPDKVFMVRGNHEDMSIANGFGFHAEFFTKFSSEIVGRTLNPILLKQAIANLINYKEIDTTLIPVEQSYVRLSRLYDFLPVALYLGTSTSDKKDFMQCCHGGMEPGYNPYLLLKSALPIKFEWLEELNRQISFETFTKDTQARLAENKKQFINFTLTDLVVNPGQYSNIGFMWNDFIVNSTDLLGYTEGRGFQYGRVLTAEILAQASDKKIIVHGVLRAHQHSAAMNEMMSSILENKKHDGISKLWEKSEATPLELWENIVCTFLVSPDSAYSRAGRLFNYDAFGLLSMGKRYKDWKLEVHRNHLDKILPSAKKIITTIAYPKSHTGSTTGKAILLDTAQKQEVYLNSFLTKINKPGQSIKDKQTILAKLEEANKKKVFNLLPRFAVNAVEQKILINMLAK